MQYRKKNKSYNYDSPYESKQYIHRIGRTARAGNEGKAINILPRKDYDNFSNVLKDKDVAIRDETTPDLEKVVMRTQERRSNNLVFRKVKQYNRNTSYYVLEILKSFYFSFNPYNSFSLFSHKSELRFETGFSKSSEILNYVTSLIYSPSVLCVW